MTSPIDRQLALGAVTYARHRVTVDCARRAGAVESHRAQNLRAYGSVLSRAVVVGCEG